MDRLVQLHKTRKLSLTKDDLSQLGVWVAIYICDDS